MNGREPHKYEHLPPRVRRLRSEKECDSYNRFPVCSSFDLFMFNAMRYIKLFPQLLLSIPSKAITVEREREGEGKKWHKLDNTQASKRVKCEEEEDGEER